MTRETAMLAVVWFCAILATVVSVTRTLLTLVRRNDERERRKQSAQARTHLHLIRAQEGR